MTKYPRPNTGQRVRGGAEDVVAGEGVVVHADDLERLGLACVYTRARCHSSLIFLVAIGILHIKEIGEGQCQKALV